MQHVDAVRHVAKKSARSQREKAKNRIAVCNRGKHKSETKGDLNGHKSMKVRKCEADNHAPCSDRTLKASLARFGFKLSRPHPNHESVEKVGDKGAGRLQSNEDRNGESQTQKHFRISGDKCDDWQQNIEDDLLEQRPGLSQVRPCIDPVEIERRIQAGDHPKKRDLQEPRGRFMVFGEQAD